MRGIPSLSAALLLMTLAVPAAASGPAAAADVCAPLFHPVPRSAQSLTDPTWLGAGDFTADGRPDVAFSRWVAFDPSGIAGTGIGVLANRGSGVFGKPGADLVRVPGHVPRAVVGELTGDGRLDLVAAGEATGMQVFAGDGNGGFTSRPTPAGADVRHVVGVADVNRDGRSDVIAAGPQLLEGVDLHVLLGDGAGGFVLRFSVRIAGDAAAAELADLNGDGALDLVTGSFLGNFANAPIIVLLGDGSGGFTELGSPVIWRGPRPPAGIHQLELADFDRDGRLDLLLRQFQAGELALALGDGAGRFRQRNRGWSAPPNAYPDSIAVGHFDGDRVPDVAFGQWTFDETAGRPTWITILRGDGNSGWVEAPGSPYEDRVGSGLLVAVDLDDDGFDDLVGVDVPTAGSGTLHVLRNAGTRARPGYRIPIRAHPPVVRMRFPRSHGDMPVVDSTSDLIYGERARFGAKLTCEPAARAGRKLALVRRLATTAGKYGPWQRIAVRTTGRRGKVTEADRPPRHAQYQWRPADRRRPRTRRSPVQTIEVAPRVTVAVRSNGTVTGSVAPSMPGARVRFYASDGGGQDEERWKHVGTAAIDRTGAFQHRALRGGVEYIAVMAPSDRYAAGISPRFG